jgi:predicted amidophosphoribosyltransferase
MEMIAIKPRSLKGKYWTAGFCLDVHTLSSEFRGHDAYGHPVFDTVHSPAGEALFRLKYRQDQSAMAVVVDALKRFLAEWRPNVEILVAIPHSTPARRLVPEVAKRLGEVTRIPFCESCIEKTKSTKQLKDVFDYATRLEILKDAFAVGPGTVTNRRVLLFDDLYRSGATAGAAAKALLDAGATAVYLLTVTRTRSNR